MADLSDVRRSLTRTTTQARWQPSATSNATIGSSGEPRWRSWTWQDVLREVASNPAVGPSAISALNWIGNLPHWVSTPPILNANDDHSFSVEWRKPGAVLHVMFTGVFAEAYFEDESDEWETDLDAATDKLVGALRAIA